MLPKKTKMFYLLCPNNVQKKRIAINRNDINKYGVSSRGINFKQECSTKLKKQEVKLAHQTLPIRNNEMYMRKNFVRLRMMKAGVTTNIPHHFEIWIPFIERHNISLIWVKADRNDDSLFDDNTGQWSGPLGLVK